MRTLLSCLLTLMAACDSKPDAPDPPIASAAVAPSAAASSTIEPELPSLSIDPNGISASGISSGGFLAQQLHIAYSDRLMGVGAVAAGPYGCASGSLTTAMARCMSQVSQPLVTGDFIDAIRAAAAAGRIAPVENLSDDRVWLFRGALDAMVAAEVSDAARDLYLSLVNPANVVYVDDVEAAHHLPTVASGTACDQSAPPFLGACDYDAAGEILAHLYGPMNPPSDANQGQVLEIPVAADAAAGLMDFALVYLPPDCRQGVSCRLHLVFHGCLQSTETVGGALIEGAGYQRWADTNRIVLLFPQVRASATNPYGCWDWWGYSGPNHLDRNGKQLKALMQLVDRLGGTRRGDA